MEAALAIPLLVSLVFGMVEFAQFYHTKSVFQGAAREGARAGVPWNATVAQIQSAVTTTLQPAGLPTGATYTVSVANASGSTISDLSTLSSGSTFTVTVSANWGDVGAGFRPLSLISSTKQVISTCTMKKEY